jgi:hypothetical protein
MIKKMTITVIQPDIYDRFISIASKHDFDDQFFLLATVHICFCHSIAYCGGNRKTEVINDRFLIKNN